MDPPQPPEDGGTPRKSKRSRNAFLLVLLIGVSFAVYLGYRESLTSAMQARLFSDLAGKMSYKVEQGPSKSIRFPHDSPYDERLGYAGLPDYLSKLSARDYQVAAQARISPKMAELTDMGVFATYREKTKTGLTIYDCRAQELFAASYPERVYNKFEQAPPVLVSSLLFIENRELLDNTYPQRNPAVEWDRLGKAVLEKTASAVAGGHRRVQ